MPFPNPGSDARRIDWAVQSDFNVGAILNGALLNNDGAVNRESLVHFDNRDILGVCQGHVMAGAMAAIAVAADPRTVSTKSV